MRPPPLADPLPPVMLPGRTSASRSASPPFPPPEAFAPAAQSRFRTPIPPSWRRFDWSVAVLVSLVVHLGLLFSGTFFPPPPAVIRSEPPAERIVLMEMPVLDPDPPEIVHELEPAAGEPAPPMLPDLPTAVPIDAFLEPIQPPPLVTNFGNGIRTIPLAPPGNSFGHGPGMIFEIGAVDETPRARNKLPPNYPPEMHRENIAGEVEVEFVIDARGRVTQVSILHSTHPAFEAPVLAAVQNWTFRPGRKGGRDVNTRVRQIVTFNSSSSAQ